MKRLSPLAWCLSALVIAPTYAGADLLGSSVSGTLSSANATVAVATPYTSLQVIGPGVEFSGVLNATGYQTDPYTVATDFTASGFTVTVTSDARINAFLSYSGIFSLSFSDSAFTAASTLTSYTCTSVACGSIFGNGLTADTFTGNTLSLSFDDLVDSQVYTFATPNSGTPASVTPEPSAFLLLSTGVMGLAGLLKSRRR